MKWARIKDAAQEVEVTDQDPAGRYAPKIAGQFFPCYVGVTTGSTFLGGDALQAGSWIVYTAPTSPAPTPAPVVPPTVTAARAYNLFPIQTRIDIKASDDPLVKEMLAGLQVEIQAGGEVDLGSTSLQEGLAYLVAKDVSPQPAAGARKYLTQAQANNITANILP